jgi:hypothetical protein
MEASLPSTQPCLTPDPEDQSRIVSAKEFASADFVEPWTYGRKAGRRIIMAPDSLEHDQFSEPWRDLLSAYKLNHGEIVQLVRSEAWIKVPGRTDRIANIGDYLVRDSFIPVTENRVSDMIFEAVSPRARSKTRLSGAVNESQCIIIYIYIYYYIYFVGARDDSRARPARASEANSYIC